MEAERQKMERFYQRKIKNLESEISRAHSEMVTVRNYRFEACDNWKKNIAENCQQPIKR